MQEREVAIVMLCTVYVVGTCLWYAVRMWRERRPVVAAVFAGLVAVHLYIFSLPVPATPNPSPPRSPAVKEARPNE